MESCSVADRAAACREGKPLDQFDWSFNPSLPKKQAFDLATCRFIRESRDVLIIGPPGTGKCDVTTGDVKFDNFQGHWGSPQELDRFLHAYAVEKARIEARRQGHTVTEQQLQDGSFKLVVQIGSAA